MSPELYIAASTQSAGHRIKSGLTEEQDCVDKSHSLVQMLSTHKIRSTMPQATRLYSIDQSDSEMINFTHVAIINKVKGVTDHDLRGCTNN